MARHAANPRELGQLKVDALRSACHKHGLPATGRKDQLMARLIEADKAQMSKKAAAQEKPPQKGTSVLLAQRRCPIKADAMSSSSRAPASKDDLKNRAVEQRMLDTPRRQPASPCQSFYGQSPCQLPRRRLREKSPNPYRHAVDWNDDLAVMHSPQPMRMSSALSPIMIAPRRRLREKSPDPHRHGLDHRDGFEFASPLAAREQAQEKSKLAMQRSPTPTTPGRRLRSKTPERQIALMNEAYAKQKLEISSTDPAKALLSLSSKELAEMCRECGVGIWGAKSVLIERLVEAHHRSYAAASRPSATKHLDRHADDAFSGDRENGEIAREVALAPRVPDEPACELAPASRARVVPPPPSSWTAPPLPSSWTSVQVSEPVATIEPVTGLGLSIDDAAKSCNAECTSATEVAHVPSPARSPSLTLSPERPCQKVADHADRSSAALEGVAVAQSCTDTPSVEVDDPQGSSASSNDWWRNVALRWPKIVANLKAGSSVQDEIVESGGKDDAAPHSFEVSQSTLGKRSDGSPSIFDSLPSPKRHRSIAYEASPVLSLQGKRVD